MFNQPDNQPDFSKLDAAVTQWWKENDIFAKQLAIRKDNDSYVFYDGPPFMSGSIHYGHLIASVMKDVVPRYQAMKGKYVERLWGWDTHGLPIESKVEKQLGLTGRQEVLDYGLDKFIQECYKWNRLGIEDWVWYVNKIGRWVDLENAYRTMDQDYMETVWWTFKTLWDKGLVYKGLRTSMFSTDSSTPVSDFEVSMDADNYRDTEDIAVAVKFELDDKSVANLNLSGKVYLVAWTTTPWTIPSNMALAVNADAKYVAVDTGADTVIFAKDLLESVMERAKLSPDDYKVKGEFAGTDLSGSKYVPVYNYFEPGPTDYQVYTSDYVTITDGTGVLHVAPAFGEADFEMGKEWNLSFESGIDDQGNMTVGPWQGTYLRDANPAIRDDLREKGNLLFDELYTHRLPYYRYDNPLIYKTQENYFINVQKIKKQLLKSNQDINWVPEHFKHGRFEHVLETAPDWSISRSRFWGTAMPLWESKSGKQIVVASRDELMEFVNASSAETGLHMQRVTLSLDTQANFNEEQMAELISSKEDAITINADQATLSNLRHKYLGETAQESQVKPLGTEEKRNYYLVNGKPLDMHRPYIDEVKFVVDDEEYVRTDFTLDVWMDSGSMPYAQFHYPFQNKQKFEENFPGDFIAEYVGQVRAWFNVLHVLSNGLFDKPAFKNVIATGTLAGTDGRKMSKSYNNYPDPRETLDKYGSEAMRIYLVGSTIMQGNDMSFSEDELKMQVREFLLPFWNIYKYFVTYANMHGWVPKAEYAYNQRNVWGDAHPWDHIPFDSPGNELDAWMLTKLQNSIGAITQNMEEYHLPKVVTELKDLLAETSRWYIRRSRDRFAEGEDMALSVLYYVLVEFCKLAAPVAPFITEEVYRNLVTGQFEEYPESVHLTDYPVVDMAFLNQHHQLLAEMELVRAASELGQQLRANNGLKVRQPLSLAEIELSTEHDLAGDSILGWMKDLIADELNVKEVREVPKVTSSETKLVEESHKHGIKLSLETALTPELEAEGTLRELIRQIQNFRKKAGLAFGEEVQLIYSTDEKLANLIEAQKAELMDAVSAKSLKVGDAKTELKVNDSILLIDIAK